jgi:Tfp pilus assembly protein PilF
MPTARERLQAMLQSADGPTLRFGLARACLNEGQQRLAEEHLRKAVEQQADYAAAWLELGKLLRDVDLDEARTAWENARLSARHNGDKQIERQVEVLLRKL